MWRARCVATSGPPVTAVGAGFPLVFPSQTSLPASLRPAWHRVAGSLCRNLGPSRHGRCCRLSLSLSYQTSLPASLRPAWHRVAGSLCRNLGPARHGRCCRLSPSFSLSNFIALHLAPRLAPCGGLAVSQPRARLSWPLLPAFPQFFPLSNFTPLHLAPRLAPCGGLAVSQPRARPSWPLLPAFPQFFPLKLHCPSPCPPPGPVWRARCVATSGPPVTAVVAGFPPVISLSNFIARELAPRLAPCGGLAVSQPRAGPSRPLLPPLRPHLAGSLWRNPGPARHGRCCRFSPSHLSINLSSPSPRPHLGTMWRARCGATSAAPSLLR